MSCASAEATYSSNENDNERMLSLSTISALSDSSANVVSANNNLENSLVLNLAKGKSVEGLLMDVSGSVYKSGSDVEFYANEVPVDLRNVFDIVTNAAHDEHFVVSAKFSPPSDKTYYDVSYSNVGNGINKVVKVIDPTLSMYDSYIDFSSNENYGLFYDSSNSAVQTFSALFDSSQPTNNILRAINSHTNNSEHQSFLSVAEDSNFNTNYALGAADGWFYTADASTGKLLPQALNVSNDLSNNTYNYEVNPSLYTVSSSSGMYKIVCGTDYTGTEVNTTTTPKGRYVRLAGNGSDYLQISHIQVFNTEGVNVAYGKNTTTSGSLSGRPSSNAVNGDAILKRVADGYHSNTTENAWWMVDLGKEEEISSIVYYNRYEDQFHYRTIGATLSILSASSTVMYSTSMNGDPIQTYLLENGLFPIDMTNLPLYNSESAAEYVPMPDSNLSLEKFNSLFSAEELSGILPRYHFDVSGVESPNSGYSVVSSKLETDSSSNIFSLDSSDLRDNLPYMKDFVTLDHDLSFNHATLSIELSNSAASTDNIDKHFSLNATRETLLQSTFRDGEIILNNRTPSSRTETVSQTNPAQSKLETHVYYHDEGPVDGVTNDLMANQYVEYDATLLFKNPQHSSNAPYASSNNSYLDLFNNASLINNRFNSSSVQFNSNLVSSGYDDEALHVFKITPHQKLIAINGVIDSATGSEVSNYSVSANISNLPNVLPNTTETLNKLEAILNLKYVSELSISADSIKTGWNLANSPAVGHDRVTTSTASAYRSQTTVTSWPSQAAVRSVLTGINSAVHYSIDLSSNTHVNTIMNTLQQNFYIVIDWGYSSDNLNNRLIINDDDLRRTANCTNNQPIRTAIDGGIQVQTSDNVQFNFDLQLLPFDDLQLTTPVFNSTTTYKMKPNIMQYNGDEFIIDSSVSADHSLDAIEGSSTVTGWLSSADFSEMSVYVQAVNDSANNVPSSYTNLTDTYNISAFYHVPITMELFTEQQPALGDITLSLLPLTYCNLTSNAEYRVNLVSEADPISYTVEYFTSQYNELTGLYADISNSLVSSNVIDPANGYSALKWNGAAHTISVSHSGVNNSNTVVSVSKGTTNAFTLTIPDYKYLNTTAFITHCNKDIYRVRKTIGESAALASTTDTYVGTKYSTLNGYNSYSSGHVRVDSGVLLVGLSQLSFATIPRTGHNFKFKLLPDAIAVNMVNEASLTSVSNITDLTYQYINTDEESRIFTINIYRGYYGTIGQNQRYTLKRDQSVATFRIKSSEGVVAQQSFNVYADTVVTVNNLVETEGGVWGVIGDIGLKMSFTSSMLAANDVYRFDIFSKGDDISISIANPLNNVFVPSVVKSTMKTFQQYMFSGSNFDDTGAPLSINIGRLKIKNSLFSHSSFVYSIYRKPSTTSVYKNNLHLGNPANVTAWITVKTIESDTIFGKVNALKVSHLSIWRPETKNYNPSVSYLVVAPPQLVFTQMSNSPTITSLPFNTSDNSGNLVYSYLPVHDTLQQYNPYLTRNINYATANESFSISYSDTTNNVTINKLNIKTPYLYKTSPSSQIHRFIIYGNHYTVKLYLGLSDTITPLFIQQLYSGIADHMVTSPQLLNVKSYDYSTGNAVFTFLQPLLTSIGKYINLSAVYSTPSAIYSAIYGDKQEVPKSIALQLNSFFLLRFGSNGPNNGPKNAQLDLPLLQGMEVNMYTRNVVVEEDGNIKVHVYKYKPLFNLNPLNQSDQVNTIYFTQREYKVVSVPSITVKPTAIPNWNDLFASISSVPSSWIPDTNFNFTTFLSLVNYNLEAKSDIYTIIFGCENNGATKATYITKRPILTLTNKLGMPIFQITAEGVVKTPLLCTSGISLMPLTVNTPINNSLQNLTLAATDRYENSVSSSLVDL